MDQKKPSKKPSRKMKSANNLPKTTTKKKSQKKLKKIKRVRGQQLFLKRYQKANTKKKQTLENLIVLLGMILLFFICFMSVYYFMFKRTIPAPEGSQQLTVDNINTTATKVMLVAHPDDETLWGSSALYHEKYLVVCVTCGYVPERVKEFQKVMALTKDDYIMLGYPDLVKGKKSKWENEMNDIIKDISKIIGAKDWERVVTHNPDGEYGHIHHIMTSNIVTDHVDKTKLTYFGHFYWSKHLAEEKLSKISQEDFEFKVNQLIPVYRTQFYAIKNLYQMAEFEDWLTYDEWYNV